MSAALLARTALVFALVFSQTLYAGHTMLHDNGGPTHCQICLHTATGDAILTGADAGPVAGYRYQPPLCQGPAPAHPSSFKDSHPVRGPPPFPV